MKNYTVADILHHAADKWLASKKKEYWVNGGIKEKYSCCAVAQAYSDLLGWDSVKIAAIQKGLEKMGCPVHSVNAFDDGKKDKFSAKNQQARYAWLKFAATMAEEQGL